MLSSPAGYFLFLISVALLFFSSSLQNSFHLDDFHTILNNDQVHFSHFTRFLAGEGFSGTSGVAGYRPLTVFLNDLNYQIGGDRPAAYHILNLLLHIFSSWLVCAIALALFNNPQIGWLAGFLYLIHPANNELVNYISSRSTALATMFYLLAFLAWLKYRRMEQVGQSWLFLSFVSFSGSLLSKEISVTFPILILLFDGLHWKQNRPSRKDFLVYAFFVLMGLSYLAVRHWAMVPGFGDSSAMVSSGYASGRLAGLWNMTGIGFSLIWGYGGLYLFPHALTIDHPLPAFSAFLIFSGIAVIAGTIYICRKLNRPDLLFLFLWFLLNLLPVCYLASFATVSVFQENRGYLSEAGLILLLSSGIIVFQEFLSRRIQRISPAFWVAGLTIGALFFLQNQARNADWKTEVTLWSSAYEQTPDSFIVNFSLGYGYLEEGEMDRAIHFLNRALMLNPPTGYPYYLYNNIGIAWFDKGDLEKAEESYRKAIQSSAFLPEAHLNLGLVYLKQGKLTEAAEALSQNIDLNLEHMKLRIQAGIQMENQGGLIPARELFQKLDAAMPDTPEYLPLKEQIKPHQ